MTGIAYAMVEVFQSLDEFWANYFYGYFYEVFNKDLPKTLLVSS